ncbi:hypothetical protein BD293_1033 [Roseinatronobacter monicus]|uniref:Uncharacterized protein n=1 Tax=Roseinatronobacter monicus TaxID=393481 RepID=A0A543KBJ5_9RHOB|nr:hypothetical protein BD293_1033 [Roseinatronobacter monicus]
MALPERNLGELKVDGTILLIGLSVYQKQLI